MANAVYPKGRENLLNGVINFSSDTIKVVLLTSSYTYSTSHQHLSDLTGTVATSGALTSKTVTGGVASGTVPTFTALTGSTVARLAIYKDTGTGSTSPLLAYIDTKSDTTALSYAPNGSDLTLTFSSGLFTI